MLESIVEYFFPSEESIDLSDKSLDTKDVDSIVRRLKYNKNLRDLNLSLNRLGDELKNLEIIMQTLLAYNHNLVSLDLSQNMFGFRKTRSCPHYYHTFSLCGCDECNYTSVISDDARCVIHFLEESKRLGRLNLNSLNLIGNWFNFEEKSLIAKAAQGTSITKLFLYEPRDRDRYPLNAKTLCDQGNKALSLILDINEFEKSQEMLMFYYGALSDGSEISAETDSEYCETKKLR